MTAGLSRAGFDLDLRDGQMSEGAVGEVLAADGRHVEVKAALRATGYGYVFVEVASRQSGSVRPSGLSVTESEWWAWDFGFGRFVIVPTIEMKRLTLLSFQRRGISRGGDFNLQVGVCVPLPWLVVAPDGLPSTSLRELLESLV